MTATDLPPGKPGPAPAGPDRSGGGVLARTARRPDLVLLAVIGVLCLIGLVMVVSASAVLSIREHGQPWWYAMRHLGYVVLGAGALVACSRVDHRVLERFGVVLLAIAVVLLVVVLIPGIGVKVSGSRRWIPLGPVRFQPSELAKLAVAIHLAAVLARRADKVRDIRASLYPTLGVTGIIVGLVMLQPDMGTSLVIVAIAASILFVAGFPLLPMAGLSLALVAGAFLVGWLEPYRRARITSFLDPYADPTGDGYQVAQSLAALGHGGLFGVGIGESRAKWGFLPNAHTDFILAIVGDEAGLVGTLLVVGLFAGFAALGASAALRAPTRFGSLLAAGITAWVMSQAVINMGAVVRLLPVTGVPLPFVSFGGTALVITMGAAGILVDIARRGR